MEPFIGEIRLFGFGRAPRGWAVCEGQLLSINNNQALFSILGTRYGGDGRTTFQLPDLRARVPIGPSSSYPLGVMGGEDKHALTVAEMPSHNHTVTATAVVANQTAIAGHVWAGSMSYAESSDTTMASDAIAMTGQGTPHENMQPYLAMNYCIATAGIYPSRG